MVRTYETDLLLPHRQVYEGMPKQVMYSFGMLLSFFAARGEP